MLDVSRGNQENIVQKQPSRGVLTKRCSEKYVANFQESIHDKVQFKMCKATLLKSYFGMGVLM